MKYGHFDDSSKEYVITNPQTPYPWINYLGNEDFFSLISNTAGGYTFYKDAKFRRLTRYRYNNVPVDNGGKYFYINDGGDVWSPGWKPVKAEAEDDMTNFQRNFSTGEVEVEDSVIYHKTEFKERRNHYAFFSVNTPIQGFDTDRDAFKGLYNDFDKPDAVFEGEPRNSVAHGWSPCASHYIEVELAPNETKEFVFVLGYVELEQDQKWESKVGPHGEHLEPVPVHGDL